MATVRKPRRISVLRRIRCAVGETVLTLVFTTAFLVLLLLHSRSWDQDRI